MVDISVITVNYNVKEYVSQLLASLFNAAKDLSIEIFVVDNASYDGSVTFLRKKFGNRINLIPSDENLGFGRANNLVLPELKGKYTLLINPDAVVEENTLSTLFEFMESHPEAAMAGCKILNPDGSFAPESKRAIPKPSTALWKMLYLDKLFPGNRRFSEYYVPWVGENETAEVPAISGSFMFIRTAALRAVNGFDPRFFMYGEDLDLCLRISEKAGKIYYVPRTSVIHYKGESTKKERFDYTWHFYNAMYLFFKKHYTGKVNVFLRYFVQFGIVLRGAAALIKNLLTRYSGLFIDLIIMNAVLGALFVLRFTINRDFEAFEYRSGFLAIHFLLSAFFVFFSGISISYRSAYLRIAPAVKSLTLSFLLLTAVTFFAKNLAFSRIVIGAAYIVSMGALPLWRTAVRRLSGQRKGLTFRPKALIAGINPEDPETTVKILKKLENDYNISGIVVPNDKNFESEINGIPVAGTTDDLTELIFHQKPDTVIFAAGGISYREIIRNMRSAAEEGVEFKIIPENLGLMIGKSEVNDLEHYAVVNFELPYWRSVYQLFRRWMDIFPGLFLFALLSPAWLWLRFGYRKEIETIRINYSRSMSVEIRFLAAKPMQSFINFVLLLPAVISGKIGFVGAKYDSRRHFYFFKVGITGPAQQNPEADTVKAEMEYLEHYSIRRDLRIFLRFLSGNAGKAA